MNLASIDMNLLVALDALVGEGHVGRAARRIGRSQPAVSHSLMRLRELLNDPLLVRTGSKMELTPRALELRDSLPEALDAVRRLLANETFHPAMSSRRFKIVLQDHLADLIVPELVRRMHAEAPGVRLEVLPWQSPFSMDREQLQNIDFCISCSTDELRGFEPLTLFTDTEAVVIRRGHPRAARIGSLQAFLQLGHVAVVSRGRSEDPADLWLREEGIARRIHLVVPGYLQALHTVAETDLVGFVPARLAQTLASQLGLIVSRPPVDPGEYKEFIFFPYRRQRDQASLWLRKLALAIGARLEKQGLPALTGRRSKPTEPKPEPRPPRGRSPALLQ